MAHTPATADNAYYIMHENTKHGEAGTDKLSPPTQAVQDGPNACGTAAVLSHP